MKARSHLTAALIGIGMIATLPAAASPQNPVSIHKYGATTYVNGGIGQDEETAMRHMAREFPLRMTFSERKDGEFIADVPVAISDMNGKLLFKLTNAGPLLYVKLPDGKYKVSARFKGLTEIQEVTLHGKDGKNLYFHWKGTPEA